jgi:predicted ATP-grasp superfamily ATP-dependent carboligase
MHNIFVICNLLPFIVSAYTMLFVRIYVLYKCIYLGLIVSIPRRVHVNANISTNYITLMFPRIIYKANVSENSYYSINIGSLYRAPDS